MCLSDNSVYFCNPLYILFYSSVSSVGGGPVSYKPSSLTFLMVAWLAEPRESENGKKLQASQLFPRTVVLLYPTI